MTYEEELIYGLQRWILKALKYYDGRDFDEFLKDEKSFDATSYCLEVIDEIANKILDCKEILDKYKNVDFETLANIKNKIYYEDNINLVEFQELLESFFPLIMSYLIVK